MLSWMSQRINPTHSVCIILHFAISSSARRDAAIRISGSSKRMRIRYWQITVSSLSPRSSEQRTLRDPGPIGSQIPSEELARCLPPELQYACEYWVSHLERSEVEVTDKQCLDDGGPVHIFMQQYFLYWLEALSLVGQLSEGIHAIRL